MDAKLFVQRGKEINPEKALSLICGCSDARLVLIYFSVKDNVVQDFFGVFSKKLLIPFVGLRVAGFVTAAEGYCENSIAIVVLSGILEVQVINEKLDFEDAGATASRIIPLIKGGNLCLVYSANLFKKLSFLDAVLRRVQAKYPSTQFFGGVSAPNPFVMTNAGIFKDNIIFIVLRSMDFSFDLDTGFDFDEDRGDEFVINKSDEFNVYEINNRNAAEEYSHMQHMRPYFFNTLMNLLSRSDAAHVSRKLSRANERLYDGIIKACTELFGTKEKGKVKAFSVMEIDEQRDALVTDNYKSPGTIVKGIKVSKESQLSVYKRLSKRCPKSVILLINSCTMIPYWLDFDFEALEPRLKEMKNPFLLYFVFGEIGAELPCDDKRVNLVNTCVVETLALK